METKHTPITFSKNGDGALRCKDDLYLGTVITPMGNQVVRAVNNHDALLEALKATVFAIRLEPALISQQAWQELVTDCDNAITKAEH